MCALHVSFFTTNPHHARTRPVNRSYAYGQLIPDPLQRARGRALYNSSNNTRSPSLHTFPSHSPQVLELLMAGSSGPVRALGFGGGEFHETRSHEVQPVAGRPGSNRQIPQGANRILQKTPGRGEQWGSRDTQGNTGHTDTWTNLTSNPHNRPNPQTHIRYTHKAQPRDEPGAD